MLGEIVLVGENRELHERLSGRSGVGLFSVLQLKQIPDAIVYLRNPACRALTAVFLKTTMRRTQDFTLLSEICAIHAELQILLLPESAESLPPALPVQIKNIQALKENLSLDGICEAIQRATRMAKSKDHPANVSTNGNPDHQNSFSTAFLKRVGMADVPVLLHGETGVGKEVMARKLCEYSPRAHKPFLKLNCAALPSELVESELFGYEKGAFTGAVMDKPGKFEVAEGGTILLDEIGDMDIRLQAKLLQVLQDGEIQPLGSTRTVKVNVRVLAVTHRDLGRAIEEGTFREDLYYRLNVIKIVIPPLRERRSEILPLAEVLLKRHTSPGMAVPEITDELKDLMLEYPWPGNVRELENVMRRFLVYQNAKMLADELRLSIDFPVRKGPSSAAKTADTGSANGHTVSSMDRLAKESRMAEAKLLLEALQAARWNRRQAATHLNLDYRAFLYKLHKHGIVEKKKTGLIRTTSD